MKDFAIRIGLCLLVEACVFFAAGYWRSFSGYGNPVVMLLMWPSVCLAKAGATHTWLFSAVVVLALPTGVALGWRKRSRRFQLGSMAALAASYCLLGLLWFRLIWIQPTSIPLPANNPYSTDAARAATYASTYREGYHSALTGIWTTYCFRPEVPTRGFEQGQRDGAKVFQRVLNEGKAQ